MRLRSGLVLLLTCSLSCWPKPSNAADAIPRQADPVHTGLTTAGCHIGLPVKDAGFLALISLLITVTWSGDCVDGWVSGKGVAIGTVNLPNHEGWRYEGEMRHGLFNGQGTFHGPGGVTASGVFHDARIDGPIIISIEGGFRYEGGWKIDHKEGYGVETLPDGRRYEGDWRNGQKDGHGTMVWPSGNRYVGEWREGRETGTGILTYYTGQKYEGDFVNGIPNGHGKQTDPDGSVAEGEWRNGKLNGHGSIVASKSRYEGEFHNGKSDGMGTFIGTDGRSYKGEFHDGKFNGVGTLVAANGARYEGQWSDGLPDGKGKLIRAAEPPYEGTWHHGCFRDGDRHTAFGASAASCP